MLIEDFATPDVPVKIVSRLQLELGNYLSETGHGTGLRAYVGVVICEAAYKDAEEILADVRFASQLARRKKELVLYDRDMLMRYRDSSRK